MTWLANTVVVLTGLLLVALALTIFFVPARARRFLGAFASSFRAHLAEQVARLVAGIGLIAAAARMRHPLVFEVFGWLLTVTAVILLLLPWRWHQRFGQWAVPLVLRHLRIYALGALLLGGYVLYGIWPD